MKKNISIYIFSVFFIGLGAFFAYHAMGGDRVLAQALPVAGAPQPVVPVFPPAVSATSLPDYLGTVSEVFGPSFPSGSTLSIGTAKGAVTVNNFYASSTAVNEVQDVIVKETADYIFVYDPTDSSFWIAVTVPNSFETWRPVAEQDFLRTLDVSSVDACKLTVAEGVIYSAGDPYDGKALPMTFCASSTTTF